MVCHQVIWQGYQHAEKTNDKKRSAWEVFYHTTCIECCFTGSLLNAKLNHENSQRAGGDIYMACCIWRKHAGGATLKRCIDFPFRKAWREVSPPKAKHKWLVVVTLKYRSVVRTATEG